METKTGFDSKLTNKTAALYKQRDGGEGRTKTTHKEVEKWCLQSSKGKCVSLRWDVHKCVYVCAVLVGCRRGAAADTGGGHSICIPIEPGRGPSLSCAGVQGALTPLTLPLPPFRLITGNTSSQGRFWLCNLNSGSSAKQTSCSPKMFGEGRRGERGEGRGRSCWVGQHIQHNQDKQNTVLQDEKKKGRAEPTYSRWVIEPVRKHGRQGRAKGGGGAFIKDFHW